MLPLLSRRSTPHMTTHHPLHLYIFVQKCQIPDIMQKDMLEIPPGWWHIGLRATIEEAQIRADQVETSVSKDTHCVLQVTFSPLGVAHFVTTFGDASYKFQPILSKVWNRPTGVDQVVFDKGAWHFNQHLPLSMFDEDDNPLISTEFKFIV